MDQEELERGFEAYLADRSSGSNIVDLELRKIVAMLGISVLKLNTSSTRLARVNIGLAGVMVAVAVVQVIVQVLRH